MRKVLRKIFIAISTVFLLVPHALAHFSAENPEVCPQSNRLFGVQTTTSSSESIIRKLISPNGQITFSIVRDSLSLSYSVSYKSRDLISKSRLMLDFQDNGLFGKDIDVAKPVFRKVDESYNLIVGKNKKIRNQYTEMTVQMAEQMAPYRHINLVVRAFNDGIAFSYDFPKQQNWKSFSLKEENSSFNLTGNPEVLTLFRAGFTTSHEGLYTSLPYDAIHPDTLMDLPALFDFKGTYMAITEAALSDFAGMYLIKHNGVLCSKLSPLPGGNGVRVTGDLPHKSPWRVMLISDRLGDLFESNILTNLNEPCKIKEVSWIKPGKTTFLWWNGTVVSDTTIVPGNNFETNKYYIDFCARNGLEYHSVVEQGGHEWYMNNGTGYQPGTEFDVTRPVEGLDMQKVCDYAKSKGVMIRVWVHWAALYPKLEEAFIQFQKWGIRGLMVDFMDRDDQQMVNIQTEILQRAAVHHLHIQFHGAYKPTGLHRTYPNEFTREGTLNYEVNKWEKKITPDHDLNVIFTRLLAGATDYHLGGFRAVPDDQFIARNIKPVMLGTRCHMLAMYVVLESYLGMVCDSPDAYENQPGFEFLKRIPTIWDETKVLNAEVSKYITFARRKNSDWYIGTVTNHEPRVVTVSLAFLKAGSYLAEIYTDSPDCKSNPNLLIKEIKTVTPNDKLNLRLAAGGGEVIYLHQK